MAHSLQLTFHDGAGSVTGANYVLKEEGPARQGPQGVAGGGLTLMVDCGLVQGEKVGDESNREPFTFDPSSVDYLFVSHAHIDHIGRIPKLAHDGFKGKIISTPPTKEISELMLIDSMGVLEKEAKGSEHPPLYTAEDVSRSMALWETKPYHEPMQIGDFKITFKDAGHILGSSMTEIEYRGKKIVFTGDLGNSPEPLLRDTELVTDADYLVMESVYGDRVHEHRDDRKRMLVEVIMQTYNKKGTLMIPAFSLERTQLLLYELRTLVQAGTLPPLPVYLDSPLAIKVTDVYNKYGAYLNSEAMHELTGGKDLFGHKWIHKVMATEDSKALRNIPGPKIIIAGSGMSNGGRIIHHEKQYLPDPNSTLLLIGYQAARTPGRILQDGATHIKILGEDVPVNARLVTISGYSAHRDSEGLLDFVMHSVDTLKHVYVVMGEPKSALYLVQRIRDNLGVDASAPQKGEAVTLEF